MPDKVMVLPGLRPKAVARTRSCACGVVIERTIFFRERPFCAPGHTRGPLGPFRTLGWNVVLRVTSKPSHMTTFDLSAMGWVCLTAETLASAAEAFGARGLNNQSAMENMASTAIVGNSGPRRNMKE
jgi:hypothetical protein